MKSQPERRTIKRVVLAAISIALELYKHASTLSIFDDSAFNIHNIRNYASNPHNFMHRQHKDLLLLANTIIHTRDTEIEWLQNPSI